VPFRRASGEHRHRFVVGLLPGDGQSTSREHRDVSEWCIHSQRPSRQECPVLNSLTTVPCQPHHTHIHTHTHTHTMPTHRSTLPAQHMHTHGRIRYLELPIERQQCGHLLESDP
jgi:hypothetical protein